MAIRYEMPNVTRTSRYTVNETAKLLGVHRNTVRSYCNKGIIKFTFRIGRKKLIMGHEIIRFWAEKHTRQYGKI